MPAQLNQGLTKVRDLVKAGITHVGVTTDATAFAAAQVALDPANVGAANVLIKAATKTDVDFQTADYSISINGDTEFTGKAIATVGYLYGPLRTDAASRSVRAAGLTIGIQAGDTATISVRRKEEDNTP